MQVSRFLLLCLSLIIPVHCRCILRIPRLIISIDKVAAFNWLGGTSQGDARNPIWWDPRWKQSHVPITINWTLKESIKIRSYQSGTEKWRWWVTGWLKCDRKINTAHNDRSPPFLFPCNWVTYWNPPPPRCWWWSRVCGRGVCTSNLPATMKKTQLGWLFGCLVVGVGVGGRGGSGDCLGWLAGWRLSRPVECGGEEEEECWGTTQQKRPIHKERWKTKRLSQERYPAKESDWCDPIRRRSRRWSLSCWCLGKGPRRSKQVHKRFKIVCSSSRTFCRKLTREGKSDANFRAEHLLAEDRLLCF